MKQAFVHPDADIVSRCRAITKPGSYAILPLDNRVMSTLPILKCGYAQVLAAPPLSNDYVAHELIISVPGGSIKPISEQLEQFLYVLEGRMDLLLDGRAHHLMEGSYCWLPPQCDFQFSSPTEPSRVLWLRRRYKHVAGLDTPAPIISNEREVTAFSEDTYMEQHLIPYENPAFDMGVNLLNFDPGVHFGFVESHIMEHALYMLAGRGIYWLNGDYAEVQKNDFIYMAPYCPQFFYATGWEKSRYLVYKDVNRDYADWMRTG